MHQGLSRLWPALILALFCLPLFVGLGRTDLENDEAIYSFAVDRILETGDWLTPKSSPDEEAAFLEKPPLKMWIVAGAIRLGLAPHDEFGLRFWDALFGGAAFLYVFAIGSLLAGPVCGAAAVLLLFVHDGLLFEHGLRSNNMEGALFLGYCGGIYHYLAWSRSVESARRSRHALGVALYFVLGFMTKFVAAIFLPLVLATASVAIREYRTRAFGDRRIWLKSGTLAGILIAPWFIYEQYRFGSELWRIILGAHVYTRFTTYVDPQHLHPWDFYFSTMSADLQRTGGAWLVLAGAALLAIRAARGHSPEAAVILLWFALPVGVISLGTSKLYHYAYPFLPAIALAAGCAPAFVWATLGPRLVPVLGAIHRRLRESAPWTAVTERPPVRLVLLSVSGVALILAAVTLIYSPVRIRWTGATLVRVSSSFRPAVAALVLATLAGRPQRVSAVALPLLVVSMLPLDAYRATLGRLPIEKHPMRSARDCVARVQRAGGREPGLYVNVPDDLMGHPLNYYFRRIRPWERINSPSKAGLYRRLYVEQQPVLVGEPWYQEFMRRLRSRDGRFIDELARAGGLDPAAIRAHADDASPPLVSFSDVLLLLPGPYAVCSPEGAGRVAAP
ncbi:MAG: glycosyltransferase family 39 protein [Acidobacteria bacterium]|nr:glycosyltransferase family 39 protein [Acidobacteriota bacterium]